MKLLLLLLLIVSQVACKMRLTVVKEPTYKIFPFRDINNETEVSMATDLSPLSDSELE